MKIPKIQQYFLCPLASIALTVVIYWQVKIMWDLFKSYIAQ